MVIAGHRWGLLFVLDVSVIPKHVVLLRCASFEWLLLPVLQLQRCWRKPAEGLHSSLGRGVL